LALPSSWVVVGVLAAMALVSASAAVTIPGGFTSLSPSGPTASNLNFIPGQTVPNLVIAPVGTGGKVALFNGSTGTVQLIADISGWFRTTDEVPGPVTGVKATPTTWISRCRGPTRPRRPSRV